MLVIANPGLVSVDEIRNKSTRNVCDCDKCGRSHGKRDCLAFGKDCLNAVVRTTLEKCAGPRDLASLNLSQSVTQESQARLMAGVLINVEYTR